MSNERLHLSIDKNEKIRCYNFKSYSDLNLVKLKSDLYLKNINKLFKNKYEIKKKKNPVIGVFVNALDNRYETLIWEGIKKGIEDFSGDLLCFIGGSINNPYYNNIGKNKVFNLASKRNVDGIITISNSIGSFISNSMYKKFLSVFENIPLLNIGASLNNFSSLKIDNEYGMRKLVSHLIEAHGYSKIALINGPKKNNDSKHRLKVYKEVLEKYNIPINPELIVQGGFDPIFGQKAVTVLLDERKIKFDALIGSNDFVAINAIKELNKRGYSVPEDIAVVGFDNVVESKFLKQPLTTVSQPCFDIGYFAVKNILSLISGDNKIINKKIKSSLVVRRSCGCSYHEKKSLINTKKTNYYNKLKSENIYNILENVMIKIFKNHCIKKKISKWSKTILNILKYDMSIYRSNLFLIKLKNMIEISLTYQINPLCWNRIIYILFKQIVPEFKILNKHMIYDLYFKSIKIMNKIIFKKSKQPLLVMNNKDTLLLTLKKRLSTVFELNKFKEYTYNILPGFGIKNFFVAMYDNYINNYAKIIAGYKDYNKVGIQNDEHFSSNYLLPFNLKDSNNKTIKFLFSLSNKEKLFGHVLFEIENNNDKFSNIVSSELEGILEFITEEISNALKGITLYKDIKKQTNGYKIKTEKNKIQADEYRHFSIPDKIAKKYFRKLLDFMENKKPFKNPELSLLKLSELLNISRNHLSYIINVYSGLNFYDFVNSYRLKSAKKLLIKNGAAINMLDIAYESGFKSKSTFNKIFKKFTNMTPSKFRKNS